MRKADEYSNGLLGKRTQLLNSSTRPNLFAVYSGDSGFRELLWTLRLSRDHLHTSNEREADCDLATWRLIDQKLLTNIFNFPKSHYSKKRLATKNNLGGFSKFPPHILNLVEEAAFGGTTSQSSVFFHASKVRRFPCPLVRFFAVIAPRITAMLTWVRHQLNPIVEIQISFYSELWCSGGQLHCVMSLARPS